MIYSMTGFGRYEAVTEQYKMTVEMKSVNHRYLDLSIKTPKKLNMFEAPIRNLVKNDVGRGKVDMFITYEDYTDGRMSLHYNEDVAREYMNVFRQVEETFGLPGDITVSKLISMPDVLIVKHSDGDQEALWEILQDTVKQAVGAFNASRQKEGTQLLADLQEKLDHMLEMVQVIEERSPMIVQTYREELEKKVADMLEGSGIDENRIAAEVTLFADKVCVDEEIVRLKSHVLQVRDVLKKGGSVGRKLDFIVQEMNREANTILSKATDLQISDMGIELKTEIEKIREQIQNIE